MNRSPNPDLMELLRSLSPPEKRYLRQFAPTTDARSARYARLLDWLLSLPRSLSEVPPIPPQLAKNAGATQTYLYNLVLRAMRSYNDQKSQLRAIKNLLLEAQFLFQKNLFKQCARRLDKVQALATRMEDHLSLLEIQSWRRKLWKVAPKFSGKELEKLKTERKNLEQQLHHFFAWYDWYNEAYAQSQANLQDPGHYPDGPQPPTGFHPRRFALQGEAIRQLATGQQDQALQTTRRLRDWWDQHPHMVQEYPTHVRATLANLANHCLESEKFDQMPALLDQLNAVEYPSRRERLLGQRSYHLFHLRYLLLTGQWEQAQSESKLIDKWLTQNRSHLPPGAAPVFWYNFASIQFVLEDFGQVSRWCNRILDQLQTGLRDDLLLGARILQLIALFELKDFDWLGHRLRSLRRWSRRKTFATLPPEWMKALGTLAQTWFPEEQKELWQSLLQLGQAHPADFPGRTEALVWAGARAFGTSLIHRFEDLHIEEKINPDNP